MAGFLRILFNSMAAMSAIAFVLFTLLWIRSYLPQYFHIRVDHGRLLLIFIEEQDDQFQKEGNTGMKAWPWRWEEFGIAEADGYDAFYGKSIAISVSFVWIIMGSLLLPALWVFSARSRWHRRVPHLCEVCRYDLRATPDRCPECGTVPAKK